MQNELPLVLHIKWAKRCEEITSLKWSKMLWYWYSGLDFILNPWFDMSIFKVPTVNCRCIIESIKYTSLRDFCNQLFSPFQYKLNFSNIFNQKPVPYWIHSVWNSLSMSSFPCVALYRPYSVWVGATVSCWVNYWWGTGWPLLAKALSPWLMSQVQSTVSHVFGGFVCN